jgi:hypothetical protein
VFLALEPMRPPSEGGTGGAQRLLISRPAQHREDHEYYSRAFGRSAPAPATFSMALSILPHQRLQGQINGERRSGDHQRYPGLGASEDEELGRLHL